MSDDKAKKNDYKPLSSSVTNGRSNSGDQKSLKPLTKTSVNVKSPQSLKSPFKKAEKQKTPSEPKKQEIPVQTDFLIVSNGDADGAENLTFAEQTKQKKEKKRADKDFALLNNEHWLTRNGHTLTYIGLYLFS